MTAKLISSVIEPAANKVAEHTDEHADVHAAEKVLDIEQIRQYRRDGFVVVKGVLSAQMVALCNAALSDLAQGRIDKTTTNIYFEAGQDVAGLSAEEAELRVRRFDSFCSDSEVLLGAAMSPRLHLALDQLVGEARTLFQEMALVKPPEIGAPKTLHQDASYFLLKDPSLCIGTWTALDQATLENGCLQMIPGSHLWGPAPHVHETLADCHIRAEDSRLDTAVPLPMNAGDTVVFNGLLHHFSASNRSNHRRRALQFHFAQAGAVWGSEEDHHRLFYDQNGHYAGCVKGNDARVMDILTGKSQRAVVPLEPL